MAIPGRSYRCQVLRVVRPIGPAPQVIETIGPGRCVAREVGEQGVVELAGDVALEAADDLGLGLAFGGASFGVGAGLLAAAQAADGDHVQRSIGVAVAAGVEAVTVAAAGGDRDRAGTAKRRE